LWLRYSLNRSSARQWTYRGVARTAPTIFTVQVRHVGEVLFSGEQEESIDEVPTSSLKISGDVVSEDFKERRQQSGAGSRALVTGDIVGRSCQPSCVLPTADRMFCCCYYANIEPSRGPLSTSPPSFAKKINLTRSW